MTSGLESVAERAKEDEQQRDAQQIVTYPTAFSDGFVFSNGEEGGWIIAETDSVIDRRDSNADR